MVASLKNKHAMAVNKKPLTAAGTLLGMGMGGFVDGILFHQILQFHSMLSARLPQDVLINVKISMVWDGLFHAFTWITTAAGLALLWQAGKRGDVPWNGKILWGALLLGWGIFNLVEGLIDHHLLQIHHVVELAGLSVYDYLFLGSGVVFILIGVVVIRGVDKKELSGDL
jgi:uncharacterized membrane protein